MTEKQFDKWATGALDYGETIGAYTYRYGDDSHEEILYWRPNAPHRAPTIRFVSSNTFRHKDRLAIARCIAKIAGVEPPEEGAR